MNKCENFNREVNVLEMAQLHIDDLKTEIEGLKLALKESTLLAQETTILFTASVKREKDLMGAIARHKWNKYKDDECIEDVLLWELLGEVEP